MRIICIIFRAPGNRSFFLGKAARRYLRGGGVHFVNLFFEIL